MKTSLQQWIASTAILILTLGTGCASKGYDKGAATANGLQAAAQKIRQGQSARDAMLGALNQLVNDPKGDLRTQFKVFQSAYGDFDSVVKDTASKVQGMQAKGDAYFAQWDEELAKIQNEDIRNRSTARRQDVAARFATIKTRYGTVSQTFKPFLSDLADIRTALGADLTPGGIEAIKPVVAKANTDAVPLREAVNGLVAEFESLGVAMSPLVPQTK